MKFSYAYPFDIPRRARLEDTEGNFPGKGVVRFDIEANRFGRRRAKTGRITTRQAQIMLTSISIPDHIAMPSEAPTLVRISHMIKG